MSLGFVKFKEGFGGNPLYYPIPVSSSLTFPTRTVSIIKKNTSMEIPAVVDERERERERVTNSGSFPRRHKLLFGLIVTVGVLVYAAFNIWVYQYSSGNAPSPKALWQSVSSSRAGFGVLKDDSLPKQGVIFTGTVIPSVPSPTPPPRPTGPGKYACSPEGFCNLYSDTARKEYCTQTFADSLCLDQCGDKAKQCKK